MSGHSSDRLSQACLARSLVGILASAPLVLAMLIGLATFALLARKTLGSLGLEPTRDPDPVVQARKERTIKLVLGVGIAVLVQPFARSVGNAAA